MTEPALLTVHAGGIRRTRADLATLATPAATPTWRPVPHADLVAEIVAGLERRGVVVGRDEYATLGRDSARLFGVMDLRIGHLDAPEFSMALGLRAANDKTMAIQLVAAARVFVCDNMAFSGGEGGVFLRRKHTGRLDVAAMVPAAVDRFLDRAGAFRVDIDRMRDMRLGDDRAKQILFDAFVGPDPVLPIRCLPTVGRLYFADDEQRAKFADRSLWSLNNAMTEAVKDLRPVSQHRYGRAIGRYCGRFIRDAGPAAAEPVTIDV